MVCQLEIILVDTRHAGNIGAVARFMKNMGLTELTLVNPTYRGHLEAIRMAVGAEEIIERARVVDTVREAVTRCSQTFAVTRRPRRMRKNVYSPEEAAALSEHAKERIGLVFGSENLGLSNEQTRACGSIITIAISPDHPSLNLAQAVAVTTYQFCRSSLLPSRPGKRSRRTPADDAEKRILFERIVGTFTKAGFFGMAHDDKTVGDLYDILARANLDKKDVNMLMGMFKKVDNAIAGRE